MPGEQLFMKNANATLCDWPDGLPASHHTIGQEAALWAQCTMATRVVIESEECCHPAECYWLLPPASHCRNEQEAIGKLPDSGEPGGLPAAGRIPLQRHPA